MMAASVVRNGIAGINIDSHSAIPPSQHSSSMHESSVTTPSSASSTATHNSLPVVNSNEDQEGGKLGSNDQISSISPAGKKLAVSSGQGPSASLVSSSSLIHEDETDIALSQLKELEVAIEVRKVTRVDGRKTRWIEYRREKQADIQAKQKSQSKDYSTDEKSLKRKGVLKTKKPIKVKVSRAKRLTAYNIKDEKVAKPVINGESIKVEEIKEPPVVINNNNNSVDNNKNKIENIMKVEISGPIISTLGTNNVLETMKQQFLQGTIDVPDHTSNGVKEKPSRKLAKSTNGTTPPNHVNNENFKRKPGRPKKIENMKGPPTKTNNSNSNSKTETPLSSQSPLIATIPSLNSTPENMAVTSKKVDLPPLGQPAGEFYARRHYVTKGLREVRKSESGSESGGSSPIKDGSPSLSPSPQLALSPISPLTPIASESSNATNAASLKCPLITAAAKVLSTGAKKNKTAYGKKKGLKMSKKENINLTHETNGHGSIPNGSSNKDGKSGSATINEKSIPVKKRGRGRKPKCKAKEVPQKWAKTTSTVIVDVHNTMNGEPQTVIPVQNPILLRTKKSFTPPKFHKLSLISESPKESDDKSDSKDTLLDSIKLSSNKQKEFVPPVPEIVNTSPLISRSSSPSSTSRKLSTNSESASKVSQTFESGKNDSTKTKSEPNADDLLKVKNVPEILTPVSSLEVQSSVPEKVDKDEIKSSKDETDDLIEKAVPSPSADKSIIDETSANTELKSESDNKLDDELKIEENSQKLEDLEEVGMKMNVQSMSPVEEPLKKQNLDKKQKTIKNFISPTPSSPVEADSSTSNSQSSDNMPTTEKDVSESSDKVEVNLEDCQIIEDSSLSTKTNTVSCDSVDDESKASNTKSLPPNVSKGSLASKSPKKTPEKVKNKSLHAVLEKLYSPTANKSSNNVEKTSQIELNTSQIKQTVSQEENSIVENHLNPPLTVNENIASTSIHENLDEESNSENKIMDKDQKQFENKNLKSQYSVISNSDKTSVSNGKPKEKVPRFLKQLFQDEGVQNMLRSVHEEAVPNGEGTTNIDFSSHKLRPKRAHENFISESPEPDDSLLVSNSKRKKRGSEVDNVLTDEGAPSLSLNTENGARRPSLIDEAVTDISQNTNSKSLNLTTKTSKGQPESVVSSDISRKRKLSENSSSPNPGIIIGKILQPQEREIKKTKLDAPKPDSISAPIRVESERQNTVSGESNVTATEKIKKKVGRPSLPVPLKQKTNAQLVFRYRKQLSNMGISSEGLSVGQMREILNKGKGQQPKTTTHNTVKSVPPIRIKLPSGQEKIVKHVPHSHESLHKQSIVSQEKQSNRSLDNSEKKRLEYPKATELNRPVALHSEGMHSSSQLKVPRTSTPNNLSSSSNIVRNHPSDKPKHYNHDDNRPSLKYAANGTTRKAVSFAHNSPQPQITSLVQPLESLSAPNRGKIKGPGEAVRQSQRTSVRQSEGSYHYRDISLRKFNNFMQIILTPSTTKMKNSLNSRVLRELCEALKTLKRDESVRMVLLTATGSTFCQGIDLTSLQHPNHDTRKKNAENLARGIKEFLRELVQFPKVIVAGVNGSAMGLGVTMLPLFDMVFATDKAEFFLPYAKLGQVPEGGATYTFPNYYGKLQSNRLFLGQKISATQAQQIGLVSESIWPATFNQELIPKVALLASQSPQSMEGTKALMNHHIITKLELSVESECRLLLQQWTSQNFPHLCKRFLDTSEVQLQKPVNLPL